MSSGPPCSVCWEQQEHVKHLQHDHCVVNADEVADRHVYPCNWQARTPPAQCGGIFDAVCGYIFNSVSAHPDHSFATSRWMILMMPMQHADRKTSPHCADQT